MSSDSISLQFIQLNAGLCVTSRSAQGANEVGGSEKPKSAFTAEDVFILTKDFSSDPGFYWPLTHIQEEFHSSQCWGLVRGRDLLAASFVAEMADVIEIIMIASGLQFRRQGFGKILLNHIFTKFPEKEVWLEVHKENQAALEFYRGLGFKEVGRRPAYYRDGVDAILMSRPKGAQDAKGS